MNATTSRKPKNSKPENMTNESNGNTARHPEPEHIAICSYFIWEQEGRPDGREVTHWLQAEIQLPRDLETHAEALKS